MSDEGGNNVNFKVGRSGVSHVSVNTDAHCGKRLSQNRPLTLRVLRMLRFMFNGKSGKGLASDNGAKIAFE